MKFQKIKVNDNETYSCFYIHKVDSAYMEFCVVGDDIAAIKRSFSKIHELTAYNEDGSVNYITNQYNKMTDVRIFFEYMELKLAEIEDSSLLTDDDKALLKKNPDTERWFGGIQVRVTVYDNIKDQVKEIREALKIDVDTDNMDLEQYKEYVISQMSESCSAAIEDGAEVETSKGKIKFSYSLTDQSNLKTLVMSAAGSNLACPYYSSDSQCYILTSEDIMTIWIACESNILVQRAYYNALLEYIKTLSTKEDIAKVTYGMELPEEYKTKMEESAACGRAIIQATLEKYKGSSDSSNTVSAPEESNKDSKEEIEERTEESTVTTSIEESNNDK